MGKRKGIMLILDGLGDHGISEFDGATPLEAAVTPHMDRMIRDGLGGLVDPLFPGVPVGTHTGTAVLFGVTPSESAELARGPVEASGIGLDSRPGDILVRANFCTLQKEQGAYLLFDRRAGRINEETAELAESLTETDVGHGITATLRPATQHRAVLHLSGTRLSAAVSDTDPGQLTPGDPLPLCRPLDTSDDAKRVARAINRFTEIAFERLDSHPVNRIRRARRLPPANGIICRSPGIRQSPVSLINHLGLKATVVAGESTVLGLGRLLGYQTVTDDRFTSMPDTDLAAKVDAAMGALDESDIIFLHVKGPDICAHDCNPAAKRDLLETIDRALMPLIKEDIVFAVTGDHSTDCNTGKHTGDPVPSLLYAQRMRRDRCREFGEVDCARGGLGRITATGLLAMMLDNMGRMHKLCPGEARFFTHRG